MKNLLSAEFLRLSKNKLFWFLSAAAFVFGALVQIYVYIGAKVSDIEPKIDMALFAVGMVVSFVAAIFVSLFVGTEYSNGTLRNKMINGKSRTSIYFSKYIVCCVAMVAFFAFYYAGSLIFGFVLCKKFAAKASVLIIIALVLCLAAFSYVAVFLAVAMNCGKKSATAVVSLVAAMAMFFTAVMTESKLQEPEFYPSSVYMDTETGQLIEETEAPNPNYLRGTKRKVYEFINDANPTGQCVQLSGAIDDAGSVCKKEFPIYSCGLILIGTAIGMIIFRKKDIA
ncbi:MAG: ABC transporter permease subunit [Acutalibacteraceae bacterium]